MSLRLKYQEQCSALQVKCNSSILKQLPDDADDFTSWDLSNNVVGTKGAAAVIRVVATAMPNLTSLNLSANNISSAVSKDMLEYLVAHPALRHIDISNNDVRLGGPEFVELLKRNRRITSFNVENTFLRPLFTRLIEIQLHKNIEFQTRNGGSASPTGGSGSGAASGTTKTARFSFGEPSADDDSAFAAAEDDAFSAFHKVTFDSSADGARKKVPRRPTVCSEVYKEDEIDNFVPDVIEKDAKDVEWLMSQLERHDLFNHLEDFELRIAVDAMNRSERSKGDALFEEGDEDADLFFVIGGGEVELTRGGEVVGTLKRGDTTHDLMLMYAGTVKETGRMASDGVVFTLDRQTYRCILSKASKKKRAMYEGFLSSVGFLKCLNHLELLQLADALKPAQFEPGATLIKYGEVGETFYLIVEGVVEVYGRDDSQNVIKVCEFTEGDCVGELEFINNHKCVADVKAKSNVRVAKMNRHHFEMVMGPVKEVLARNASESTVYEYYRHQLEKMDDQKH